MNKAVHPLSAVCSPEDKAAQSQLYRVHDEHPPGRAFGILLCLAEQVDSSSDGQMLFTVVFERELLGLASRCMCSFVARLHVSSSIGI